MDRERFRCIVSALKRSELTSIERNFVLRVNEYFENNSMLTEQQESILEGLYREKIRWMKKGVQGEEAYTVKNAT
jgi:uncharacterized membrane-anchored protein